MFFSLIWFFFFVCSINLYGSEIFELWHESGAVSFIDISNHSQWRVLFTRYPKKRLKECWLNRDGSVDATDLRGHQWAMNKDGKLMLRFNEDLYTYQADRFCKKTPDAYNLACEKLPTSDQWISSNEMQLCEQRAIYDYYNQEVRDLVLKTVVRHQFNTYFS